MNKLRVNTVVVWTLCACLLAGGALSVVRIVGAAAPSPGHNFSESGGGIVQGDILYGSAADTLSALAKSTSSTNYLSNTGTSNNPAWAQVSLSSGVTDSLPVTNLNGGTSASSSTFWRGDGSWAAPVGRMVFGGSSSASLTASAVCDPNGNVCSGTLTSAVGATIPFDITAMNLYAVVASAPAAATTCKFTVRKSAGCTASYSATTLTCSVVGNGSTRTCSDASNTVSFSAGDCIQMNYTETGTCSGYVTWGFQGSY